MTTSHILLITTSMETNASKIQKTILSSKRIKPKLYRFRLLSKHVSSNVINFSLVIPQVINLLYRKIALTALITFV